MDTVRPENLKNDIINAKGVIEATNSTGKFRFFNILEALIKYLGKDASVGEGSAILKFIKSRLKK